MEYEQQLVEAGIALAELAVKGTASAINKRIRAAKEIKDIERLRATYDSIVNEILQEREEAVRIAQAYKSELDKIEISDDDINHLHSTISSVLDLIGTFSPGMPIQEFDTFKDLVSVNTLKAMQLIGFNYKAAIGEPLTQLCANAILSLGEKKKATTGNSQVKKR